MIRVAFTLIGGPGWTGGRNYLLNLLRVLVTHATATVAPLLFVDSALDDAELSAFAAIPGVQIVRTAALRATRRRRALLRTLVAGRDGRLHEEFLRQRVEVIFESARFFGWRPGLPVIAWIPDFQHRAMPEMFTRTARLKRELGFRAQVHSGRTIMVSSEHARAACEKYYPSTVGRTFTVRFAVPPPRIDAAAARAVAAGYGLPEQFVYLPNQFWRHKNHQLVVEALTILKDSKTPATVAASGSPLDPRNPGHFQALSGLVRGRGLEGSFRILGIVPHDHVAALMFASTALLNPSLYEGWSTTVEEARALGTALILSDIPVHREQAGVDATYFDPTSAAALAAVLRDLPPVSAADRTAACAAAHAAATHRTRAFAAQFVQVVAACLRRQAVAS